jgi:hypothetical protein
MGIQNLSKKFIKRSGLSYVSKRDSKASKRKPRTSQTVANKRKRIETIYNRLFKISQKSKKYWESQDETYRKLHALYGRSFFCDKYPDLHSFSKNYTLKGTK